MHSSGRALIAVIGALTLFGACQKQPAAMVELPGDRMENPEIGLALAAVPKPFEAVAADGPSWTFDAPGEGGSGRLVLTVGPVESGSINLVDAVKARKEWFESTEGATYYGKRELGGPFGTILTARGAYPVPDGEVEETWAYAIHPGAYRLISVQYTYPTGESGTRVEQLMEFLGELEALGP